eukprot:2216901-Ditylum_brightwellii.AAC.1
MSKQSSLRPSLPNNGVLPSLVTSYLDKSKGHSLSTSHSANRVAVDVVVFFRVVFGIDKNVKFEIML